MGETIKAITLNTAIPIGMVITVAMGFYNLGRLSERVSTIENAVATYASQTDITYIRDDIREIKEILKPFNFEIK